MFSSTHIKVITKYELFKNNSSFMYLSVKSSA